MKSINLADLPQSARDLIDLIGLPATVALIQAMPGIKYPIPVGEANNPAGAARFSYLVEAVGDEAARILVREFGGDDLYVPSCKRAIILARDREIVAAYDKGDQVWELALRYKLSYRSIEIILKKTDTSLVPDEKQADLFA